MLCSEAHIVNQDGFEGHASILRCKRWSCDLCNPFNHRRIKRAAREGKPTTFLTLTVNPARYATPDAAARDLKQAWVNVRRAMERELGIRHPPFIAIFEQTKAGWPHLHILMRCRFVAQRWFSETMRRLIGAPIVDVRFIQDASRVAAYVAKYISKAPEAFAHCKRWWRSHDYQVEATECLPFRRFGTQVSEHRGSMSDVIWAVTGGRAQVVESRDGYCRWTLADVSTVTNRRNKSRYAAARS